MTCDDPLGTRQKGAIEPCLEGGIARWVTPVRYTGNIVRLLDAPQNITYPIKSTRIIFEIAATRFELVRVNVKKLPENYCICVSCMTLPAQDPCPFRIVFSPLPALKLSELIG